MTMVASLRIGVFTSPGYSAEGVAEYLETLPESFILVGAPSDRAIKAWKKKKRQVLFFQMDDDYVKAFGDVAPMKHREAIIASAEKVVVFWDCVSQAEAHAIRISMMGGKLQRINTPWGVLRVKP